MSGHSKWAQIKRQKGVADTRRGQVFTKLTREIMLAARTGGGNLESNYQLRLVVQKAKDNNMPSENIERAIKRAAGGGEGANLVEILFEGYGTNGVAVLIEALTDNRNRTVQEIRSTLTRHGGSLVRPAVSPGCSRRAVLLPSMRRTVGRMTSPCRR
jgi:YebC/PmpR family DNA-binding regulatory protein